MKRKKVTKEKDVIKDSVKRTRFGTERVGIMRRSLTWVKRMVTPEASMEGDSLWVIFRTKERKAMKIAKDVADIIELEYSRENGVDFLNAFSRLCLSCTPDCINKIFGMMLKYPIYFKRDLSDTIITWMTTLPSSADHSFVVEVDPIKVDYLNEMYVRANMMTQTGPYIAAKFVTSQDNDNPLVVTRGVFNVYMDAGSLFNYDWDFPGVIRYSVSVSVQYIDETDMADQSMVMTIIRKCAANILLNPLWEGYFGEDRPQTSKKSRPYYKATIGCSEWAASMDDLATSGNMVKTRESISRTMTEEYTAVRDYVRESATETDWVTSNKSNFKISGDMGDDAPAKSFVITIYPPLEDRPKKTPVEPVINVHRSDDNSTSQSSDETEGGEYDEEESYEE